MRVRRFQRTAALLKSGVFPVKFANRAHEVAPMAILRRTLRRLRIASLEPSPHALVVTVGQTLGEVVRLLIESRKESTDRLLGAVCHDIYDGPQPVNKQAWP